MIGANTCGPCPSGAHTCEPQLERSEHLQAPPGVEVVRVESANEMLAACETVVDEVDVLIGAAAVSDFRPGDPREHKLKRADVAARRLELVENPDILATLSARLRQRGGALVVGFAAETGDVEAHARDKLVRKGCDLVVGNLVGLDRGFGRGQTEVLLVSRAPAAVPFGPGPKPEVAEFVLDQVVAARSKS